MGVVNVDSMNEYAFNDMCEMILHKTYKGSKILRMDTVNDSVKTMVVIAVNKVVFVNCDNSGNPIDLDYLKAFRNDMAIGASKGIIISTCEFDNGSVDYIHNNGLNIMLINYEVLREYAKILDIDLVRDEKPQSDVKRHISKRKREEQVVTFREFVPISAGALGMLMTFLMIFMWVAVPVVLMVLRPEYLMHGIMFFTVPNIIIGCIYQMNGSVIIGDLMMIHWILADFLMVLLMLFF